MDRKFLRAAGPGAETRRRRAASAFAAVFLLTAVSASGQFRFEDVVGGLTHAEPSVRVSSMRLLAESGFLEGAAPLAVLLTDPIEAIQLEAIATETELLAGSRFPARRRIARLIKVNNDSARDAFWAGPGLPVHIAPVEVVRGLLDAMHDDNPRVRVEATYAFGALVTPDMDRAAPEDVKKAFDLLAGHMSDPDPEQRLAAAAVTGRLLDECGSRVSPPDPGKFGDVFVTALNDSDRFVRLNSTWVLGLLRHERSVQSLSEQLAFHEHGLEAEAAFAALARIAHPSSAPLFWSMLASKDPALRRHAIEGIGRLGDRNRAAELEAATSREHDASTNLAVAFAFHLLRQGSYLEHMIEAANRPATRDQARSYLLEIGPSVTGSLTAYLQDPSPRVRSLVAEVVGRVCPPTAIPALEPLVKDQDPAVRIAATRAIARLRR